MPSKPEPTATQARVVTLHRGLNFGSMLESPIEEEWSSLVNKEYFDLV